MPSVSFLVPDIGEPTIGAALKLARLIEPDFRTEIVGPDFGRGICSLYREEYCFNSIPAGRLYRYPDYWWEGRRLARAVTGDLVVAVKAVASTVPVALHLKKRRGVPVAVYLDEWDGALWHGLTPREKVRSLLQHFHHPLEAPYVPMIEHRLKEADIVLSSTTWLQKRFGGDVVHAGVDAEWFAPKPRSEVEKLREEWGLSGKKVIVFGGVVRPHKGVEEILDALSLIQRDDLRLFVVGPLTEHLAELCNRLDAQRYLVVAGDPLNAPRQRNTDIHKNMPLFLDAGDLVVLPLRDTMLASSQMPIKLYEAMAMGKPIIGSAVSDLPMILDGCGYIVPPGDVHALAAAIVHVFDNEEEARSYGTRARQMCLAKYSLAASRSKLLDVLSQLLQQQ